MEDFRHVLHENGSTVIRIWKKKFQLFFLKIIFKCTEMFLNPKMKNLIRSKISQKKILPSCIILLSSIIQKYPTFQLLHLSIFERIEFRHSLLICQFNHAFYAGFRCIADLKIVITWDKILQTRITCAVAPFQSRVLSSNSIGWSCFPFQSSLINSRS